MTAADTDDDYDNVVTVPVPNGLAASTGAVFVVRVQPDPKTYAAPPKPDPVPPWVRKDSRGRR